VLRALRELAARRPTIEWLAPLERPSPPVNVAFAKPRDEAMLTGPALDTMETSSRP
jgi:hypothetical protein